MTNQESLLPQQKRYKEYLNLERGVIKPCLEELWYLRFPVFTGVLSCIFFAVIPQTLEVYLVFALNATWQGGRIAFSFGFIFLLSLSIWYSGRALSIKRKDELTEKYKEWAETLNEFSARQHKISLSGIKEFLKAIRKSFFTTLCGFWSVLFLKPQEITHLRNQEENSCSSALARVKALVWLPRIFGAMPLGALIWGLFSTPKTEAFCNLYIGIAITFGLFLIFLAFVINRKAFVINRKPLFSRCRTNDDSLFSPSFQAIVYFFSTLVFSVFTLPLVIDAIAKTIASIAVISILLVILWRSNLLTQKRTLLCLGLSAFFVLLTASFYPAAIPSFLGSISIVAAFLSVFVIFTSFFFYHGYNSKIAFLTSMAALAILFSWLNLNDIHRLRELPLNDIQHFKESPESVQLPELKESFDRWIKPRRDEISKDQNLPPYPIYIVSAQGGGIFAAYHAALTLSRLQDLSPTFASHIFAISGVSGGSLGATVFSSLVKTQHTGCYDGMLPALKEGLLDGNSLEAKAHCLLNQDFLSPLLAAGLFPDFFQRFIPPIPFSSFISFLRETLDRARGLEYAFEHAWFAQDWKEIPNPLALHYEHRDPPNPLEASYYEHWQPEEQPPALVLNTTVVETGERLLLSPFTFKSPSNSKFPVLADISTVACLVDEQGNALNNDEHSADNKRHRIDFSLSTAAVLSARFPLVTPAAWFEKCKDKNGSPIEEYRAHLTDGGLFENSGFSTAYEIGQRLEEFVKQKEYKGFKVVYLAITNNSSGLDSKIRAAEIFSPFITLSNSKNAVGRNVIEQAEYEIDGTKGKDIFEHDFRQFYLTHAAPNSPVKACVQVSQEKRCEEPSESKNFNLPLGWYLSSFSQEYIRNRIGYPGACPSGKSGELLYNNHCVMQSIIDELSPKQSNG